MTSIILSSLKNSAKAIWKHKLLFLVVLLFQALFLSAWFGNQFYFQKRINDNMMSVMEQVQSEIPTEMNITQSFLSQQSLVSEQFLGAIESYGKIIYDVRMWLIVSAIIFAVFNGLVWGFSNKIVDSRFFLYYWRFVGVSAVYFLIIIAVFQLSVASTNITAEDVGKTFTSASYFFLISVAIILYLMPISFTIIRNRRMREIPKRTFLVGVKKIHYVLAAYLISVLLLAIPIVFVWYLMDNVILLTLGAVFFLITITYARMFIMSLINQLDSL